MLRIIQCSLILFDVIAAEWTVCKAYIASLTFDWKPQTITLPVMQRTTYMDNGMERYFICWRIPILPETSRWSDLSLEHHDNRLLNCCVMRFHTGHAPCIMVWSCIGFHCHTTLVHISGILNSYLYISEVLEIMVNHTFNACHQSYSNRITIDLMWHAIFTSSSIPIRLNCFLDLLVLPIYRQSNTFGQCLHKDCSEI